jgi:hypothetical protein
MLLGLKQLGVCRELLLDGSSAKARMALILLDALADSLIYRRLQSLYGISEQRFAPQGPRVYSTKQRRQAKMNFERRVELAQDSFPPGGLTWDEGPILDELDAAIVLVGHSYRKDAHHHDTHNPAVIGPIGRVMFAAVARMFTRSQPAGLYVGYSRVRLDALAAHGIEDDRTRRMTPRDYAAQGAARTLVGLELGEAELAAALTADLEARADQAVEDAEFLPLDPDELNEALARYELWIKHSADEDFIELLRQMDPAARAVVGKLETIPQAYFREAEQAERDLHTRIAEIERTERPTANLGLIDTARNVAGRLRDETELALLLAEYHETDRELRVLEECLLMGVEEWDRRLQLADDLRRGK